MVDKDQESGWTPPEPARSSQAPPQPRRWRLWLLLAAFVLLVGGVVFATQWPGSIRQSETKPLDGELIVLVRPTERDKELIQVDEANAVPVRAGGSMSLEVRLNEPAFTYLVWLNCESRAVPLYPWNHDALEVTDVNQPPPVRKATTLIFNPPMGSGWKFGKRGGLETVLLLVRRTPLDAGTRLGPLLEPLTPPKVRHRGEAAVLGLNRGADSVSTLQALNRGTEEEARAVDEPLRTIMFRLSDHFEMIRAVRFAHVEEAQTENK